VSDIDTAVVDSLKVLDLKRPIRQADIRGIATFLVALGVRTDKARALGNNSRTQELEFVFVIFLKLRVESAGAEGNFHHHPRSIRRLPARLPDPEFG
jgi:hypothetical protein